MVNKALVWRVPADREMANKALVWCVPADTEMVNKALVWRVPADREMANKAPVWVVHPLLVGTEMHHFTDCSSEIAFVSVASNNWKCSCRYVSGI